jgi:DNA-binding XRE family transcriptional regulator
MPARERQTPEELAARIRAARAYARIDQVTAAKEFDVAPATLGSYEDGKIPKSKIAGLIERSTQTFGLPESFYVIDFKELTQMNDAWGRVKRLRRPLADLERLVDQELDQDPQS